MTTRRVTQCASPTNGGARGSRASRLRATLERRWALARLLGATRAGRTAPALAQALGASRSTVYRDLQFLREMGMPVADEPRNGEVRYRLLSEASPRLVSPLRRAALDIACQALEPLRGTELLAEVEALRKELEGTARMRIGRAPRPGPTADPKALANVERSIVESRTARLEYRGARDRLARSREVIPIQYRLVRGQLYLDAHDIAADAPRTFKLVRVESATVGAKIDRRAFPVPDCSRSVGVWTTDPVDVAIRIGPSVARFAREYPLVDEQTLSPEADGAVVVRARVAGLQEVLRWVLAWGGGAEVLAPLSLRNVVRSELTAALAPYQRAGPVKAGRAKRAVSPMVRPGPGNMLDGPGAKDTVDQAARRFLLK